jgi:hypothetical protein
MEFSEANLNPLRRQSSISTTVNGTRSLRSILTGKIIAIPNLVRMVVLKHVWILMLKYSGNMRKN